MNDLTWLDGLGHLAQLVEQRFEVPQLTTRNPYDYESKAIAAKTNFAFWFGVNGYKDVERGFRQGQKRAILGSSPSCLRYSPYAVARKRLAHSSMNALI